MGCVRKLKEELDAESYVSKARELKGVHAGGKSFSRGSLYSLLKNPLYLGKVVHQGKHYEGQHAAIVDSALWQSAQDLSSENKQRHEIRTSVKDPSLLAGLLFDDNGNPMSPTHTTKHNRRYRYYVSQAVLQYREKDAGTVLRVPANTIEGMVINRLKQLWLAPKELHTTLKDYSLDVTQHTTVFNKANQLAQAWEHNTPQQHLKLLKTCIQSVQLGRHETTLVLSRNGLLTCLLETDPSRCKSSNLIQDPFTLIISAQLKRYGIEIQIDCARTGRGQPTPAHDQCLAEHDAKKFTLA